MNIRELYINYFVSKGHKQIPSSPVVPENDSSVLFNICEASNYILFPFLLQLPVAMPAVAAVPSAARLSV